MRSKVQWVLALGSALAVLLSAASAQPPAEPEGRAELAGTWALVAFEYEGKRTDLRKEGGLSYGSITIKGQEFTRGWGAAFVGGTDEKGTFKIASREKGVFKVDSDYTRHHGADDIRPTGTKSEHTDKELWELVDKDTLRICRAPGKDRPDSFKTKKDDGREVMEYTRGAKEKK
jgi:uncharacterized protein (TIGR03067 family)